MKRLLIFAAVVLAIVLPATAQKKPAKSLTSAAQQKWIEHVRGSFDMTKNPRPYIVYMVLDQEGNRWPSFWCGKNVEGVIKFTGEHDVLEDTVVVKQTGSFTCELTNIARKYGMFDELPGGEWAESLREKPIRITFHSFENPVLTGTRTDHGDRAMSGNLILVEATCSGTVQAGGKTAPFAGTARLEFSDYTPVFRIAAKFSFPGKELGLVGAKGQGITATFYTASTPTVAKPSLRE
jgi:hypothetical protein